MDSSKTILSTMHIKKRIDWVKNGDCMCKRKRRDCVKKVSITIHRRERMDWVKKVLITMYEGNSPD